MAIDTQNEGPGFERDENEPPEDHDSENPGTLEDEPLPVDAGDGDDDTLEAQGDAAEYRTEGGYQ
jgi:hypothetical protein